MKLWVHTLIIAVMFSGCATMKVSEMVEKRSSELYTITRVSNAYFNPRDEMIFLDIELMYRGKKQSEKVCFEFTTENINEGRDFGVTLEKEFMRACSSLNETYIQMPIKIGRYFYLPKRGNEGRLQYIPVEIKRDKYLFLSKESVDSPFVPWAIYSKHNRVYLVHSERKASAAVHIPTVSEVENPEVYLLYPLSLTLDIVTLPITVPFYILYRSYDAYFHYAMQP